LFRNVARTRNLIRPNWLKSGAHACRLNNVFFLICSAKGFRENMFQFEQTEDVFLGAQAVPASIIGL